MMTRNQLLLATVMSVASATIGSAIALAIFKVVGWL